MIDAIYGGLFVIGLGMIISGIVLSPAVLLYLRRMTLK